MSLTPQQRFDIAQLIHFDINSVSEIKLGAAANNAGVGICRILNSTQINLRPETEAALNESLMTAINTALDDLKAILDTEFNTTMNPMPS